MLPGRLKQAEQIGRQIAAAGMTQGTKATPVNSTIFSGGLYGTEVGGATPQHIRGLQKVVAFALWKNASPRNRLATLLQWGMEPWVHMCVKTLMFWWRLTDRGFSAKSSGKIIGRRVKKAEDGQMGPYNTWSNLV